MPTDQETGSQFFFLKLIFISSSVQLKASRGGFFLLGLFHLGPKPGARRGALRSQVPCQRWKVVRARPVTFPGPFLPCAQLKEEAGYGLEL